MSGGGCGGAGPCGACKFLRRKCVKGCIFAPYFDTEQGSTHFAAVHKVFGASNVSKLLLRIPVHKRLDAVVTICYEALARIRDPVYGCVSHIFALQQQVVNLQAELALIQADLATFELPSHAIQPFQSPSPALPSNHESSNMLMTTTPDITTHIGPSQSLHQPVVDSSATRCSPSEPPLDDDDLHAVAREFFSRCFPGGRFHPSDPC